MRRLGTLSDFTGTISSVRTLYFAFDRYNGPKANCCNTAWWTVTEFILFNAIKVGGGFAQIWSFLLSFYSLPDFLTILSVHYVIDLTRSSERVVSDENVTSTIYPLQWSRTQRKKLCFWLLQIANQNNNIHAPPYTIWSHMIFKGNSISK